MAACAVMAASAMTSTIAANADYVRNTTDEITSSDMSAIFNKDGFKSCANVLLNNSETLGIDESMFEAVVGTPFNIASVDSDMNVSVDNSVLLYPVICDSDIVAIISASKNDGDFNFSVSKSFADELDSVLSTTSEIALINDDFGNVYSVDDHGTTEVVFSEDNSTIQEYTFSFDDVDDFNNVLSDLHITDESKELTDWYNGTRAVTTRKLSGYPSVTQIGANCWAYTILSMYRYKVGNTSIEQVYTDFSIANGETYVLNSGATLTESYNTINRMFGRSGYTPEKTTSKISATQIVRNIQQDLPIYIKGTRTASDGTTVGHAVALMGYERDGNTLTGFYVMNPQAGNIEYNTYNSTNCYFRNSSNTARYLWNGTVTLNGTL